MSPRDQQPEQYTETFSETVTGSNADLPPVPPAEGASPKNKKDLVHTRTRATYFGWIIGLVIAILLLVFILINLNSQEIDLLFWNVNVPVGVSLLIAAIAGALITATLGTARMFQLRRALNAAKKK